MVEGAIPIEPTREAASLQRVVIGKRREAPGVINGLVAMLL
jgi:hypothetical protein